VLPTLVSPGELAALATNWCEQDELVQLELEESLSALEAYERQLDAWREQLVAERAELQTQREELAQHATNQAALQAQAYDDRAELQLKLKHLANELAAERQTSAVLSTTQLAELADLRSELTDCEHRRQQSDLAAAKLATEVATLKLRESELLGLLASAQLGAALATNQAAANASTPQPSAPVASEPTKRSGSDPVVGSVVAQFDKLRLQRQAAKQGRSS
jgi:chromosome segregation ATPase